MAEAEQVAAPEDELALEEGGGTYQGYEEGNYVEGEYEGYYDEQGNLIGLVPGTAMADAFSQAGYYDNAAYPENAEGGQEQPAQAPAGEEQPAQAPAGEAGGDQAPPQAETEAETKAEGETKAEAATETKAEAATEGEERLEDIVEDLKRKNATE